MEVQAKTNQKPCPQTKAGYIFIPVFLRNPHSGYKKLICNYPKVQTSRMIQIALTF